MTSSSAAWQSAPETLAFVSYGDDDDDDDTSGGNGGVGDGWGAAVQAFTGAGTGAATTTLAREFQHCSKISGKYGFTGWWNY